MPMLDDEAADAVLASRYGASRAANMPDAHTLELWDGNPNVAGSAELPATNGYAAADVAPADWSTPAARKTTALVTFDAPTGPWPTATYWVLRGDDGYGYDYGTTTEQVDVTGASPAGPQVAVTVFYPANT